MDHSFVFISGDIHLAMFRASKLENVEAASKPEQSEAQEETNTSSNGVAPTTVLYAMR